MSQRLPKTTATLSTTIQAILAGPERGILVLGLLFAFVFAFSLWKTENSPVAIYGVGAGLVGLFALLVAWLFTPKRFGHSSVPLAYTQDREGGFSVSTESAPDKAFEILAWIRETAQNRKSVPNPHGKVEGAPQKTEDLREYSAVEQEQIGESIRQHASAHARQVVEDIAQAEHGLLASGATATSENTSEPI